MTFRLAVAVALAWSCCLAEPLSAQSSEAERDELMCTARRAATLGVNLYREAARAPDASNVVVAPVSTLQLLSALAAASDGETARQLRRAVVLNGTPERDELLRLPRRVITASEARFAPRTSLSPAERLAAWGVELADVADGSGVAIRAIAENSPAAKQRLSADVLVLEIDGVKVASLAEAKAALARSGDATEFVVAAPGDAAKFRHRLPYPTAGTATPTPNADREPSSNDGSSEEDRSPPSSNEAADDHTDRFKLRYAAGLWTAGDARLVPSFRQSLETHGWATREVRSFVGPDGRAFHDDLRDLLGDSPTAERLSSNLPLDENTRLVAAVGVELRAGWTSAFDRRQTRPARFWVTPNRSVDVEMMFQRDCPMRVLDRPESEAVVVEIGFRDVDHSLLIFLPRATDGLQRVEKSLSADGLQSAFASLSQIPYSGGRLYLPRLDVRTLNDLAPPLRALGVNAAFDPAQASFPMVTGERPLALARVVQAAHLSFDEAGVSVDAAAAATLGGLGGGAKAVIQVDHPFMFAIRDGRTDAVVFLGRVVDPSRP